MFLSCWSPKDQGSRSLLSLHRPTVYTSPTKLGQKRFLHALALSASLHLQVHKSIAVPVWEKSRKLIGSSVICIKRPTLIPHEEYNFLQFIICHLPVCFTPLNWLLNTSELFMSFGVVVCTQVLVVLFHLTQSQPRFVIFFPLAVPCVQ